MTVRCVNPCEKCAHIARCAPFKMAVRIFYEGREAEARLRHEHGPPSLVIDCEGLFTPLRKVRVEDGKKPA